MLQLWQISYMKKRWYETSLGVMLLLVVFFPSGLFYMWKETSWSRKTKWLITMFFLFLILGFSTLTNLEADKDSLEQNHTSSITDSPPSEAKQVITETPTMVPSTTPTDSPKPTVVSKKITDKINNLVTQSYPQFEITIWNQNSEFASEGQIPYEVILNGPLDKTVASNCDDAKKLSYYMLETIYKDSEIRPTLSRVMITIPYYLRVSLGASDGVQMEQNGSFSGPTNFWTVMEKVGLGENESGELKKRTWGTYLTKCE